MLLRWTGSVLQGERHPMAISGRALAHGPAPLVDALKLLGNRLYIGGSFSRLRPGVPASNLPWYDPATMRAHAMGDVGVNGRVRALACCWALEVGR